MLRFLTLGLLAGLLLVSSARAGIELTGSNNATVSVDGIVRAEPGGLRVEPKDGGGNQLVAWDFLDLDALRAAHPDLYAAYLRTRRGDIVPLHLGTATAPVFEFDPDSGYEVLEEVAWIDTSYSDGDSFYALHEGERYIFRLYQVDCPEEDQNYPDRLNDQAEYFGVTAAEVIELGNEATAFTAARLKEGGLTVYTKWHDARGNSQIPRHYAFVVLADGRLLSESLIEAGLARVFGMRAGHPDGSVNAEWVARLREIEEGAKAAGVGGWADAEDG